MDFKEFYQSTYKQILRFFYYRGLVLTECEDLMSEAFTRLLEGYPNMIETDNRRAKAIVFGIATNLWKDYLTEKNQLPQIELDPDFAEILEAGPAEYNDDFEKALAIVKAEITKLNNTIRQVLELRFIEKLTRKQVAERLKISEDQVHTYQKRGIQYLKKILIPPSY